MPRIISAFPPMRPKAVAALEAQHAPAFQDDPDQALTLHRAMSTKSPKSAKFDECKLVRIQSYI